MKDSKRGRVESSYEAETEGEDISEQRRNLSCHRRRMIKLRFNWSDVVGWKPNGETKILHGPIQAVATGTLPR